MTTALFTVTLFILGCMCLLLGFIFGAMFMVFYYKQKEHSR